MATNSASLGVPKNHTNPKYDTDEDGQVENADNADRADIADLAVLGLI